MKNLTFIQTDDLENYKEINQYLSNIGYQFSHNYKNIPFYSKYTICKSIGDLINLYNINYLLRQNKIPYRKKAYIEVDKELKQISDYKQYSYVTCNKELKRLRNLYFKTQDPIYILKQNEICIKKAQVDYLRANHVFLYTKQYYMLPESAIVYQNMIYKLAKSGDVLKLTKNYQLSTSSIIIILQYCIHAVKNGHAYVSSSKEYQYLNTTGRLLEWINGKLKPNKFYRQLGLCRNLPEDHKWATPNDYCIYIDSYYNKLSNITGETYLKTQFIINKLGEVQFKVPKLILRFFNKI